MIYLSYSSTILKVSPDLHHHNFKVQGQDPGTCEVCCANDFDNNVEEAGKSMEEMKKLLSVWMQDQH